MEAWTICGVLGVVPMVLPTSGGAWFRPDLAAQVATGTVAHDLWSETFVSGPDSAGAYAGSIAPRPGLKLIAPLLHYRVDRDQGTARASLAGGFASQAVYRGRDGCMLVGRMPAPGGKAMPAPPSDAPLAVSDSAALAGVLDAAFAEQDGAAPRNTKAVVILHRGRIVAERYAPGYGPDTPIPTEGSQCVG